MKLSVVFFAFICLLYLSFAVAAAEFLDDEEVLTTRGKGVVTQSDFVANAEKIPAGTRQAALRNGKRLESVLYTMLLKSQLAADAREDGFDEMPIVIRRMKLAADSELADAWLQHYVSSQPAADYVQLAQEYYLLNEDKLRSSQKIDVSHILISSKSRSDEEAKELAGKVHVEILADPASFDELVSKYSEDPSALQNKGKFRQVKKGDMVAPFERVSFALQPGEISEPVKTDYGYHIIRLDAQIAPEQMSFEDVKERLVARERQRHEDRIKQDYIGGLTSLDVNLTEEALTEMVSRLIGEEMPEQEANHENSE